MNEKEALLREIREHPETHQHPDPDTLLDCCLNGGGVPDFDILEVHARYAPLCTCHLRPCACASSAARLFSAAFLLV